MAPTPDSEPRIPPLPPRQWTPEAMEAIQKMTPPPDSVYEERRRERGGAGGVNALGLLACHPKLASGFLDFNRYLLYECGLDERTRELVVLRVAWRLRSPYEWGQHVPVAKQCGLSDEEILLIAQEGRSQSWSDDDWALLAATDSLLGSGQIDDATWAVLSERRDSETLLDLVFTIGGYATLAMAFNAAGLPLDPDISGFPGT